MCIKTDGSEKPLPDGAEVISDNSISIVYRGHDGFIYKRSIPFLIENELYFLKSMFDSGFVPSVERYDKYTLKIKDLGESQKITRPKRFVAKMEQLRSALVEANIRHGDLTEYAIIVRRNHPYVIDFAESRPFFPYIPAKRRYPDSYRILLTTRKLLRRSGYDDEGRKIT